LRFIFAHPHQHQHQRPHPRSAPARRPAQRSTKFTFLSAGRSGAVPFPSPVKPERESLAVAPIQEVAHCVPASGVEFGIRLRLLTSAVISRGLRFVFGAAVGATIGEPRLIGLELELFRANAADSDRECPPEILIFAHSMITDAPTLEHVPLLTGNRRTGAQVAASVATLQSSEARS